jgi:hypothetical protein
MQVEYEQIQGDQGQLVCVVGEATNSVAIEMLKQQLIVKDGTVSIDCGTY